MYVIFGMVFVDHFFVLIIDIVELNLMVTITRFHVVCVDKCKDRKKGFCVNPKRYWNDKRSQVFLIQ